MAIPYIDTPRTEVDANATYLIHGFRSANRNNLSALDSLENSFQSPSKDGPLLKGVDRRRENIFKTPKGASSKSRIPLNKRHLPKLGPGNGEFTPLLNSVVKNNLSHHRGNSYPETPAPGLRSQPDFSTTPRSENITYHDDGSDDTGFQATPLPQVADSSVESSPLPVLPDQNGNIVGDGQKMTLKEQEKASIHPNRARSETNGSYFLQAIDRLDKENFNLKLQVHFLQKQVHKSKPEYKEQVHQENLKLKTEKISLQRDVKKYRQQLKAAGQQLTTYQQELREVKEKAQRKYSDEGLKMDLEEKNARLQELMNEYEEAKKDHSEKITDLNEAISDLQYDLRERDRVIDEKDEHIEKLQKNISDSKVVDELQENLDHAHEQIEELRDMLKQAKYEASDSKKALQTVSEKNEELKGQLKEAQNEIFNKSSTSKDLNRQTEERIRALQKDLESSREESTEYERKLMDKSRQLQDIKETLQQKERASEAEKRLLENEVSSINRKYEALRREREDLSHQMRSMNDEARDRREAEHLLKSRHDALMAESDSLQRDLEGAKSTIAELEELVESERQQSASELEELRVQYDDKINRLSDQLNAIQHELEDKIGRHAADTDKWESVKRSLEIQKEKAEQQAASYKRTVDKLQNAESSLSSKEQKLQNIVESERQRHKDESLLLNRQIKELNDNIAERRKTAETQRAELLKVKEELRISKRDEDALREKVQALEDEIIVLQSSLEEQQEFVKARPTNESSNLQQQLQAITKEKRALQNKLSDAQAENIDLKTAKAEVEAERDELSDRLQRLRDLDGTSSRIDEEKAELQRIKARTEAEVDRLRQERISLIESRNSLRDDLEQVYERAATQEAKLTSQIDQLESDLRIVNEKRDRALTAAKIKAEQLQKRVEELEELLARQDSTTEATAISSPGSHLLRRRLDEARQKEKTILRRESELKASFKALKAQVANLERENHELRTKELSAPSPKTPSAALQEEVRALRKQVLDSQKLAKDLRKQKRELERLKIREEEREDLHELLKSSTLEAESLTLKLSERDARVQELRSHLRRVRDERTTLAKQIEEMQGNADVLEQQYQDALDELQEQGERKRRHAKELKGLSMEIQWLRARFFRERKFREDLAWSKGLMELGERVRAACNETDLQMIAEMGVDIPIAERQRSARRKFRAAAWTVIAVSRMQKFSAQWRDEKHVADGLRRAKQDLARKRDGARRKKRFSY